MSIGNRIKDVRKHEKLSRKEFGSRLGVSMDTIANMEYDRLKKPEQKEPLYKLICTEFGVSYEWLTTGLGDMFEPVSQKDELAKFVGKILRDEEPTFVNKFVEMLAALDPEDWKVLEKAVEILKRVN